MPAKLTLADLDAATKKRLGVKSPRKKGMTMDQIRGHALAAMGPLAQFSQAERRRILKHAVKVNEV